MIEYQYNEEKTLALYFSDLLDDSLSEYILTRGFVSSKEEAVHLSRFFWAMVNKSEKEKVALPCEGSPQYWTEKLHNSLGGYLERAGYEEQWNEEVDRA
ncbi:hypothetical protein [Microbulbifer halophilus]|uniref:CdiI immunity protein domain-containing protein n=1 Tax=Microbulbifer halophilus TaxID=453963 RepID=A0ABW5EH45_9GAMM|nr:hypothetical protein [Microbulbifer halophilus]MCW8128610.1 hypothetical protein [Microbulbifer halophilus]